MIKEKVYKELIEDYHMGHDILFYYKGKRYFLSHCGENDTDYLDGSMDRSETLAKCESGKGLTDIKIDGKPIIEILKDESAVLDTIY